MDRLIDHIDIEAKEPIVSYTFSLLKQFSTLGLVNCMGALLKPTCMRQSKWWNINQRHHTHKLLHSELKQTQK